jgi:hypothetical protein
MPTFKMKRKNALHTIKVGIQGVHFVAPSLDYFFTKPGDALNDLTTVPSAIFQT